ncbi:MAG: hypothetical protein VKL39_24695, partial [Leptolyngbyaceae bacterium]|nr:hypothetical protein [Leptolyngbyaceae bacterium]
MNPAMERLHRLLDLWKARQGEIRYQKKRPPGEGWKPYTSKKGKTGWKYQPDASPARAERHLPVHVRGTEEPPKPASAPPRAPAGGGTSGAAGEGTYRRVSADTALKALTEHDPKDIDGLVQKLGGDAAAMREDGDLRKRWKRRLARLVHPDHNPDPKADAAMKRLSAVVRALEHGDEDTQHTTRMTGEAIMRWAHGPTHLVSEQDVFKEIDDMFARVPEKILRDRMAHHHEGTVREQLGKPVGSATRDELLGVMKYIAKRNRDWRILVGAVLQWKHGGAPKLSEQEAFQQIDQAFERLPEPLLRKELGLWLDKHVRKHTGKSADDATLD